MRWPIADTADRLAPIGSKSYICSKTYGAALACPAGRELRQAHGRYRKQKQPAFSEAPRWRAGGTQ